MGDCNGSDEVTVGEVLKLVNIVLGTAQPSACPQGVPSGGAGVDVAVIIQAVNNALEGCPMPPGTCGGIAGLPCDRGELCDLRDPTCSVADLAGTCVPGPLSCPLGGVTRRAAATP